jgi:hypothetical protein
LVLALASAPAAARLPPPTPEEQAPLAAKQAREQAQLAVEQEALTRAQDRVAQRYGRDGSAAARTGEALLPKTVIELPGGAGPHGRREPSAEAHSGNAR